MLFSKQEGSCAVWYGGTDLCCALSRKEAVSCGKEEGICVVR